MTIQITTEKAAVSHCARLSAKQPGNPWKLRLTKSLSANAMAYTRVIAQDGGAPGGDARELAYDEPRTDL